MTPLKNEKLEVPKFVIDELDRMHLLLTHPGADQTMKQWAREKVDALYELIFPRPIFIREMK